MPHQESRFQLTCLLLLTACCLVPIWAFKYFPTTDGASHLENAYTLLHLADSDRDFGRYYDLNAAPTPNWFSHLALAGLMVLLPPLIAEKVMLSGYVVFFTLAMLYYLRSVNRESGLYAFLAVPFIYNVTLQMGFYNFAFSVPVMFAVLGFWWRRRWRPVTPGTAIALNAALIALFFFHLVTLVLTLATITGMAVLLHRKDLARAMSLLAALTPSVVLPAYFVGSWGAATAGEYRLGDLAALFRLEVLVSHHPGTQYVADAIALLFAALLVVTLVWNRSGLRQRTLQFRLEERDLFLLAAIATVILYWLIPQSIAGGSFMHERLAIYPFLLLLPWLTTRLARPLRDALVVVAVILTAAHLTLLSDRFAALDELLEDYTSGIEQVGKNDVILPICCDQKVLSDTRICTFLHAQGYYCVETGAIELANYEAKARHFPLRYTAEMNPFGRVLTNENKPWTAQPDAHPVRVDFILIWFGRGDEYASRFLDRYEVVHRQGRLMLLKRMPDAPEPR